MPTEKQREAAQRAKEFLDEYSARVGDDIPIESAGWGNDLTVADLRTLIEAIIPPQKVYEGPYAELQRSIDEAPSFEEMEDTRRRGEAWDDIMRRGL